MNHIVIANTLQRDLRGVLLDHLDGDAPFDVSDRARKPIAFALIDKGLLDFRDDARRATMITDDGRRVLAGVLAHYADKLSRAGYTGLESPNTKRAIAAAAEVDRIEWRPEEWRVATRFGSAVFGGWRQVQVFDLLYKKRGTRGLTIERIIDIVCADDRDGSVCAGTMKTTIKAMRRTVEPAGVRIVAGTPSGRDGYSLAVAAPSLQFA